MSQYHPAENGVQSLLSAKACWEVDALKKGLGMMLGGALGSSPTDSVSGRRVCGRSPALASRLTLESVFLSQSRAQMRF